MNAEQMRQYMRNYRQIRRLSNCPTGHRKDGIPEQANVREALAKYVGGFETISAAARKIGTDTNTLGKWRRGAEAIPLWFCEFLGFQRHGRKPGPVSYEFVGKVRFSPTGKSA